MTEGKRKWKIILMHAVILPSLVVGITLFNSSPKSWLGVDEAVVEKIAAEHGRKASPPLIDPGSGDLLLFVFLVAGAAGGFVAGYNWRELARKK